MRKPARRATVEVEVVYLTEPEAAAYLRLAPQTLAHWRADGLQRGPRFRDHGVIVYKVDDLDSWSEGRAALSTMESGSKKKQQIPTEEARGAVSATQ